MVCSVACACGNPRINALHACGPRSLFMEKKSGTKEKKLSEALGSTVGLHFLRAYPL